jgi:glycosyltransferase involved in cell wall biosynthesis
MPSGPPHHPTFRPHGRRLGLLSTYPPRLCGLATFAAALEAELTLAGEHVTAVAINDGRRRGGERPRTEHELVNGVPASVRETARVLSRDDVAIVQHEYGIYGGVDGDEVVDVLRGLAVPAILILHTVLADPTPHQRSVLETACGLAGRIVVMTEAAGARLAAGYAVDVSKVVMIPHGAASPVGEREGDSAPHTGHAPRLLTWGLLGPGKGIEHVIQALSLLVDRRPRIRYTVAGATHPNVLARDGEQYRQSLIRQAWASGVAGSITFDDAYRDLDQLARLVASASVVVLPYDSREQVTSGVLVDAIAAGRPVIATAFPHAVELLSDGAGIVVPHGDPVALAAAIASVANDPELLESMTRRARELAPSLTWRSVAAQYRELCDSVISADVAVAAG